MGSTSKHNAGFTLVELFIVVQIIMILAAIGIPNLLRARMSANETNAAGAMRTLSYAQSSFKAAGFVDADGDGEADYGTLAQLHNPDGMGISAPFIDEVLATGAKTGYRYAVNLIPGQAGVTQPAYNIVAVPLTPGRSGMKFYYVDDSAVIRFTADGTPVGPGSQPIQ